MDIETYALLKKRIDAIIVEQLPELVGKCDFTFNATNGHLTIDLKNLNGDVVDSKTVDLPTEMIVQTGRYDAENKEIVLVLADEAHTEIRIPVGALITDLERQINENKTAIEGLEDSKQDKIDDLDGIREGAGLGKTAVQPNDLSDVATSGSYNDLTDKPTIPTKTSQLTNDSNFTTKAYVDNTRESIEVELSSVKIDVNGNKTDIANLKTGKQDKITEDNKLDYSLVGNTPTIPSKTSDLTNDSGFLTEHQTLKTINGTDIRGSGNVDIRTYQAVPESWKIDGTMAQLISSIKNDSSAIKGMAYLDTIKCSDLPLPGSAGYKQAECIIDIISGSGSGKIILFTLNSADTKPYHWEYNSYEPGWRAFLVENNVKTIKVNGVENSIIGTGSIDIITGGSGIGDYSLLINKPKVNNVELTGNKTLGDLGIDIPDVSDFITKDVDNLTNYTKTSELGAVALSNDYEDLDNKPTIPTVPTNVSAFTNDAGYLTSHQSLDGYATEEWVEDKGYLTQHQDISGKQDKSTLESDVASKGFTKFSGSYNDLTDKPTIPTVPTVVSAFTNDVGYLTEHQDISGKVDKIVASAANPRLYAMADAPTSYVVSIDGRKGTIPEIRSDGVFAINKRLDFKNDADDAHYTRIYVESAPSTDVTIKLPQTSGTMALTSDIPTIPTVPTKVSQLTNDKYFSSIQGRTYTDSIFNASVTGAIADTGFVNMVAGTGGFNLISIDIKLPNGTCRPGIFYDDGSYWKLAYFNVGGVLTSDGLLAGSGASVHLLTASEIREV